VAASASLKLLANAIDHDGADPNEVDELGRTPLMLACSYALSTTVVALLLRKGADPRAMSKSGWVPLHFVALNNTSDAAPDICRLLLEAGADPTVVTDNRQTAITLAKSVQASRPQLRSRAIIALLEKWIGREYPGKADMSQLVVRAAPGLG
jgi:ankyrin repeat protein